MAVEIGITLGIPPPVMGLTVLAAGALHLGGRPSRKERSGRVDGREASCGTKQNFYVFADITE